MNKAIEKSELGFDMEVLKMNNGRRFVRTPVGSYWGNPTDEEIEEISLWHSSKEDVAVVTRRNVGDLAGSFVDGFEISYFDR